MKKFFKGGAMRKFAAIFFAVMLAVFSLSYFAFSEGNMKHVTIKGEILDLAYYLGDGEKGVSHKQCALKCAKAGTPIGILDEKAGNAYLLLPGHSKKERADFAALVAKAGTTVTVKGMLVESKTISAILLGSGHDD